jgi:hypothetical protein
MPFLTSEVQTSFKLLLPTELRECAWALLLSCQKCLANTFKSDIKKYFVTKALISSFAAFQQMGYRFSPTFIQNLMAKYDPRTRRLTLDNFIVACVQIKRLTGM